MANRSLWMRALILLSVVVCGAGYPGNFEPDDDCQSAVPVDLGPGGIYVEDGISIHPAGDRDWRSFELPQAATVRVEILGDDVGEESAVTLWREPCADLRREGFAFRLDPLGLIPRIESACLRPGEYFVEVGGWPPGSTQPDDLTLEIEHTADCGMCEPPGVEQNPWPLESWRQSCPGGSSEDPELEIYLDFANDFRPFEPFEEFCPKDTCTRRVCFEINDGISCNTICDPQPCRPSCTTPPGLELALCGVSDVGEMCEVLSPGRAAEQCTRARAEYMALLLNLASGRLDLCEANPECYCFENVFDPALTTGPGATFFGTPQGSSMTALEVARLLGGFTVFLLNCEAVGAVSERINTGVTLVDPGDPPNGDDERDDEGDDEDGDDEQDDEDEDDDVVA